jgi:hypothetical protein
MKNRRKYRKMAAGEMAKIMKMWASAKISAYGGGVAASINRKMKYNHQRQLAARKHAWRLCACALARASAAAAMAYKTALHTKLAPAATAINATSKRMRCSLRMQRIARGGAHGNGSCNNNNARMAKTWHGMAASAKM